MWASACHQVSSGDNYSFSSVAKVKVSPMGIRRGPPRQKFHSGLQDGSWPRTLNLFFSPRQVQLLCSKTKANNGHPSSHGEDKKEKSRKPAFENHGCWTPSSSRAWLQPTFWQPQRSTVLFSKTMSALKETTKREREAFQRLWKNVEAGRLFLVTDSNLRNL